MEESVIACVLKEPSTYNIIRDILGSKDFWWQPYSYIWECFDRLQAKGSNIDNITLEDELRRIGYYEKITNFTGEYAESEVIKYIEQKDIKTDNAETYALQVSDDSNKRKIQEGDNIKDNTPILVSLSKVQATGDKIIEAETLSFKEFIDLSNKPIPAEKIGSQYFYTTPGEYSVPINSIIKNSLENPGEYEVYFKIFEPEITIRKRFLVK